VRVPIDIIYEPMYLEQATFVFGSVLEADEQLREAEYFLARSEFGAAGAFALELLLPTASVRVQLTFLVTDSAIHLFGVVAALRANIEDIHVEPNH
jgi:hypothetical protein